MPAPQLSQQRLVTDTIPGNLHQAAALINDRQLADYVVTMEFNGGGYTTVVYRMHQITIEIAKQHRLIPQGG